MAEVLPGWAYSSWYGLFGPARMPPADVARIADAARAAIASEALTARFKEEGLVAMGSTPAEIDRSVRAEIVRWGEVVKATGTKPE